MYPLRIYKKSYIIVSMLTDTQITPVYAKARKDIRLSPGDTVRVYQKIVEKDKVRIQVFEGGYHCIQTWNRARRDIYCKEKEFRRHRC